MVTLAIGRIDPSSFMMGRSREMMYDVMDDRDTR
jgi:hypothetical protein